MAKSECEAGRQIEAGDTEGERERERERQAELDMQGQRTLNQKE